MRDATIEVDCVALFQIEELVSDLNARDALDQGCAFFPSVAHRLRSTCLTGFEIHLDDLHVPLEVWREEFVLHRRTRSTDPLPIFLADDFVILSVIINESEHRRAESSGDLSERCYRGRRHLVLYLADEAARNASASSDILKGEVPVLSYFSDALTETSGLIVPTLTLFDWPWGALTLFTMMHFCGSVDTHDSHANQLFGTPYASFPVWLDVLQLQLDSPGIRTVVIPCSPRLRVKLYWTTIKYCLTALQRQL